MFGLRSISTSKSYLATLLGDSFWTDTMLLLNGENAGTGSFLDTSANATTGTPSGSPLQGTFSPFPLEGGSAYFNGTSDFISFPAVSGAYTTAGEFTFEAWVYWTGSTECMIAGQWQQGSTSNSSWIFDIDVSGVLIFACYIGSTYSQLVGTTRIVPKNRWCHVAVVRNSSNVIRLYVDGIADATTLTLSGVINNSAANVTIGRVVGASTVYMTGYISNFRFTKNVTIYTGNFTPPSSPLTALSGTQLLLRFENGLVTDQTRSIDLSVLGNTSISTSITKFGSKSIDLDGTGDYLTLSGSSKMRFGNGAVTVEGWFYFRSITGNPILWRLIGGSTLSLYYDSSVSRIVLDNTGTPLITTAAGLLTTGTWYHIAVVRTEGAGNVTLYLNGTSVGSASVSAATDFSASTQITIGALETNATRGVNGLIDDFRITRGSARYTSAFSTPPAAFFAPTLNTYRDLFVDGTGSSVVDSSGNSNTLTNTGVTLASDTGVRGTAVGNALVFNGSAYIKTAASNKFFLGNNADWTIEAWIKPSAADKFIFGSGSSSVASWTGNGYHMTGAFYSNAGGVMGCEFRTGSGTTSLTRGTTVVSLNVWTHVAYVHDGLSRILTIYVNGRPDVSFSTATWATAVFNPELSIGSFSGPTPTAGNFTGSMDNFTYSHGLAKYKSSFVPDALDAGANLLVKASGSSATDISTSARTITLTTATVSAGTSPFGSSYSSIATNSGYFDPSGTFAFGSSNYTIETWVRWNAALSYFTGSSEYTGVILGNTTNTAGTLEFIAASNTSSAPTRINISTASGTGGATGTLSANFAFALNTWYHIAAVRNGSITTIYVNGTAVGSATITGSYVSNSPRFGRQSITNYFGTSNMNLFDTRVTLGAARYTSNFVAPTAPF